MARVAQPNTAQSDLLEFVLHRVSGTRLDGSEPFEVKVMAREPGDALDRVACMPQEEFMALPRVAP